MEVNVTAICSDAEWLRLEHQWNRLVDGSDSGTTFLTWEWARAWWDAYGQQDELFILAATDERGALRGLAPLRRRTIRRYGQHYVMIEFLGDGSSDSDYLDFIVARDAHEPVMRAFGDFLRVEMERGAILRLGEVPGTSPNLPILRELAQEAIGTEHAIPCATVQLPATWDDYLKLLKPRFRTKVRAVLRNLESRPEVRFGFCETQNDVDRLLPVLFELHTRRWQQDGQAGVFGWEGKQRFYAHLSRLLLARGVLRFSWLEWKGQILAAQYGFVHGSTYLHLQEGYEPAAEHWNVGMGLRAWTIQQFQKSGVTEYDFLAGVGRHKLDWGAETKQSYQIIAAAHGARNLLFCRAPEWNTRLRERIKAAVPESVLAIRRARLDRRRAAPTGDAGPLRRTAARCYVGLGLPAAAQRVRHRYQLSLTGGRVPWPSISRRRQPAGRIFCYHRVNDERDPFFPAMPTAIFEQQMRFIASRYRVVSVSGLLAHLESGSPETVLALTFDDGYADNYENAFPVLQRYGLPATIFLSTGSLDSAEPLWFEQLAAALKTSPREFLDLEFDLPRRFWLRTETERLHSNGELFRLLRHLPDLERRERLPAIFRELAAPASTQRAGTMLTWDQVRQMKPAGVDFGGHTVSHPYLSKLRPDQAAWEVAECKRRIEAELQLPVAHFAYPNGRAEDFASWNKDVVRAAGYEAALTTLWGLNYQSTDRMELRRSGPWEEDPALFAYKMDWYDLVNG